MDENRRGRRVRGAVRVAGLVASLVTAVVVSIGSGGAGVAVALSSHAGPGVAASGRRMALMVAADPGPFWNWNHFMALVHGVSDPAEQASGGSVSRGAHHLVTIDPTFATNKPTVTDCSTTGCVTLPKQPANFVYLHTGPGNSYPLAGDPILHPRGNGTTVDSDWGIRPPSSRHSPTPGAAATGRLCGSPARRPGSTTLPARIKPHGTPAAG